MENLRWLLPSAAGLIALVAWQRYTTRHREWNETGASTIPGPQHVRDPVTSNKVDTARAFTAGAGGKTFYFESAASRAAFQRDPARYVHRHHHGCC
ncbi:YHS domain-containing protein [Cupriavidus oxalaticus]|uniref:YHS domain-containing protein n=1 Tax=Cupriavidus oxalaticus TaxID=96344 RepID=A0A5P3VK17_9BURK|nr:YHS domain-containing protein [Cupriavidus oxalaticus]